MLFVILLFAFAACSNGSDTIEEEVPPPTEGVASVALMLEIVAVDVLVDAASVTRDGEILSVSGVGPTTIAVPGGARLHPRRHHRL